MGQAPSKKALEITGYNGFLGRGHGEKIATPAASINKPLAISLQVAYFIGSCD